MAPIRREYEEHMKNVFDSAEKQESLFTDVYGSRIPDDYYQQFVVMLQRIRTWIENRLSGIGPEDIQFSCPILKFELLDCFTNTKENEEKTLGLMMVVVRPCAERNGFYKKLLWSLRNEVEHHNLSSLFIYKPMGINVDILKSLGFTDRIYYMEMDNTTLKNVTEKRWNIRNVFPTAETLNATTNRIVNGV